MPNHCPSCSRDFGIRKIEGLILVKFQDKEGMAPRQEMSNGYYCTACNAHWIRPKNEVQ